MNRRSLGIALGVVLLAGALAAAVVAGKDPKPIVVGKTDAPTSTALPAPEVIPEPEPEPAGEPAPEEVKVDEPSRGRSVGLKMANGRPYGNAIPFNSNIAVPTELQFVLVIGSDARPGEDVRSARADSVHLLAVNPATRRGTIVGFPRDSYVDIPGKGRGKINDALARGGPRLMAETVRRVTGLPVHYYVVTGFAGLVALVDDLGGVDVFVERRMNDRASGARFEPGWHRFDGHEALAYTRNRTDTPNGDFGRSQNHGNLILATLGKFRSEVGDEAGLARWIDVLRRHVELDVPIGELPRLGALGRDLDPPAIVNLVVPGRIGTAGRASVVYLTEEASRVFVDLRDDALVNGSARTPAQPAPGGPQPAPEEGPPAEAPPPTEQTVPAETTTTTARGLRLF